MTKIKLDSVKNIRTFQGIPMGDGRLIRSGRFIRSSFLAELSDEDAKVLVEQLGVRTVIDLRTDQEVAEKPDRIPEGVTYYHVPLLDESALGITHDQATEALRTKPVEKKTGTASKSADKPDAKAADKQDAKAVDEQDAQAADKQDALAVDEQDAQAADKQDALAVDDQDAMAADNEDAQEEDFHDIAIPDMEELYAGLVTNEFSVQGLRKVMALIMESAEHGAVLWHCTEGKDRCGLVSALFLSMLGVEWKYILKDYMETRKVSHKKAFKYYWLIRIFKKNKRIAEAVRQAYSVKESFLQRAFYEMEDACGCAQGFLQEKLGVSDGMLKRARVLARGEHEC